jgi:hypothetical protein
MNEQAAFTQRAEAEEGLTELADACLAVIENGGDESGFPEPVEFLRSRGTEVPDDVSLTITHGAVEAGNQPEKKPECWLRCKTWGDETWCIWVCP